MEIIIIGGCGFIGTNLSKKLVGMGYDVLVVDRNDCLPEDYPVSVDYSKCDFVSGEGLEDVISEDSVVIHLVSTSVPNSSNMHILEDAMNNIIPSVRLIDICAKKKVRKLVYSSSGGQIYGIPNTLPINEHHETNPQSAYGIQKLAIEKYMQLYKKMYGLNIAIMRIANPYGHGQQPYRGQGVIATFLASAFEGREIEIWGDGTSVRDYIYIDDLMDAFLKVIKYDGDEEIFNIGSGIGTSVNAILEDIEAITDKTINKRYIPIKTENINANVLDCEKAYSELGWRAYTPIYEGIKNMAQFWNFEKRKFD